MPRNRLVNLLGAGEVAHHAAVDFHVRVGSEVLQLDLDEGVARIAGLQDGFARRFLVADLQIPQVLERLLCRLAHLVERLVRLHVEKSDLVFADDLVVAGAGYLDIRAGGKHSQPEQHGTGREQVTEGYEAGGLVHPLADRGFGRRFHQAQSVRLEPACKKTSQRAENRNPARVRTLVLALVWSGVWLCGAARGAGLPGPLPPVSGTVSGSFRLGAQSPVLAWRVATQPAGNGELSLVVSADSPGGRVRAHALVSAATGDGTWQLDEGRVELAPWSAALVEKFPALAGWQAGGTLTAEGRGTLQHGGIDGTVTLALAGGSLHNEAKKISCDGISLHLVFGGLRPLRADPGQEFAVATLTAPGTELHNLKISFALAPGGEVRVASAEAEGFGGKISTEPFVFNPAQSQLAFTVHASNIDLAEVRASLDPERQRIREATGRVSGQIALHLDRDGLRLGRGWFALSGGESARFLFQPTPGLFTSYLPANIRDVYSGFAPIELGKLPMVVKKFQVELYPDGESAGHTARLQLEGNSTDPRLPAPIVLDVNIDGPLQEAVQRYLSLGNKP